MLLIFETRNSGDVCEITVSGGTTAESSVEESAPNHISCYHCNSAYDPRCGDPFEAYSLGTVNCSLIDQREHLPGIRPTICRKNVQKGKR